MPVPDRRNEADALIAATALRPLNQKFDKDGQRLIVLCARDEAG